MQAYHNSFFAMGTRFNAVFAYDDENVCENTFQLLRAEVLRIEKRLNIFDPFSDISIINNTAGNKSIEPDEELFGIMETCSYYSRITNGAYDITMRYLAEAKNHNQNCGSFDEKVILNRELKTVRLKNDYIKMDFGGFGKGYALEKIKKIMDSTPIKNCLISFGESSILAMGAHPAGNCWKLGIRDFLNPANSVYQAELTNYSMSVSSNYNFDDNNRLINTGHIINPLTLQADKELKAAIVEAPSPVQSEILSTAFINMNPQDISGLLKQMPEVKAVIIRYEEDSIKITHMNE